MRAAKMKERPSFQLMVQTDVQSIYHMQMPRWLFSDPRYCEMSLDAKVTYTFLLNRFQLSRRNGWVNERGEVFVIFPRKALAKELRICEQRVTAAFKKLVELELVWEKRCGRGDANQIYLAYVTPQDDPNYTSAPFTALEKSGGSRTSDSEPLEGAEKSAPLQDPQDLHFNHQIALTFGNTVEQHGHGVGRAVFHVLFLIFMELSLCLPQDHTVQPPQLCPHAALRQCGVSDAVAVGVIKALNGIFKHQCCSRRKTGKLTGIQNTQKIILSFFVRQSVMCGFQNGRTDFYLTTINLSFFFLTWHHFLRFCSHALCGSKTAEFTVLIFDNVDDAVKIYAQKFEVSN